MKHGRPARVCRGAAADRRAPSRRRALAIWEVFFLVRVGRGSQLAELSPEENEVVCHFLVDASRYGSSFAPSRPPFFRRVAAWRQEGRACDTGALYERLAARLLTLLGDPRTKTRAQTKGTRDGKGIVFVSHDGHVYPAGFLRSRSAHPRAEPR